jgi:hypothetical protein
MQLQLRGRSSLRRPPGVEPEEGRNLVPRLGIAPHHYREGHLQPARAEAAEDTRQHPLEAATDRGDAKG